MPQDRRIPLLIVGGLLVILAGFIQNTDWINLFGVKINLILASVLVLGLFINNPWHRIILAIIGTALTGQPGWNTESLVLLALLIAAPYFKNYLFGQPAFNNIILIFTATIAFYLIINPGFLISYPAVVLLEVIYNLIFGSMLYFILEKKYAVYI
ncbi:MAG: hypothetical protein Q8P76_00040 [bacterium]|nr:hypothetical protein [bacterium]